MPASGEWRPPRWAVPLFGLAALALLPWAAVLVKALPSAHRATHWDVAWAGFDVALALVLLAVALAAWRRSPWLEGAATAGATLLFVDAWFDILTSSTRTELFVAIVDAGLVELPLAIVCLLLARDAERRFLRPLLADREAGRSAFEHERNDVPRRRKPFLGRAARADHLELSELAAIGAVLDAKRERTRLTAAALREPARDLAPVPAAEPPVDRRLERVRATADAKPVRDALAASG
jgi:hypothetical protein